MKIDSAPGAERARDGEHEGQARQALKQQYQPFNPIINQPAELARDRAHQKPKRDGCQSGDEGEQDCAASTPDQAREEVTTQMIVPSQLSKLGSLSRFRISMASGAYGATSGADLCNSH
ncbi:MAG: hypothetical protein AAGA87_03185 [Pseudomonadota bacterium]